jgi:VWFA-related protein
MRRLTIQFVSGLGLITGLMLGPVAIGAQEPAPSIPAAEFGASIDVRSVNVEVVVTDRSGKRVQGLTAADFRLKVDGRQVPIDGFTAVVNGQAASPAAEPEPSPEAARSVGTETSAPAEAATSAVGTSYLVFVDDTFALGTERELMLKRLQADLPVGPADRMAIVAFDGRRLDLLKDWTGDREALRQTLQEIRNRKSYGINRLVQRARAGDGGELGAGESEDLLLSTQSAAQAAAGAMRGVSLPPGRKVLLLISGGWASLPQRPLLDFPDTSEVPAFSKLPTAANLASPAQWFEPVTGTANLLGYTIYPVLLPQHRVTAPGNDVLPAAPTAIEDLGFLSSPWERNVNATMGYIADETGGRVLFNTLRTSVFTSIQEDTRSYYELGFTPEWHADGGNHRITVDVLRPGLKARNRSSFADLSKAETAGLRRDSLLLFGITPQAVIMQAEAGTPKRAGIGLIEVPVTLVIPVKVLKPRAAEGGYVLRGRLSVNIVDQGGGTTQMRDLPVMLKLPVAPREEDFARYHTKLKLRRVEQTLTFALLDEEGDGEGRAKLDLKP